MKKWLYIPLLFLFSPLYSDSAIAYSHEGIRSFSHNGNTLTGIATKSQGAKQFEIWRSSIAVGSQTPKHVHETEEVFVILKGHILCVIGDEKVYCKGPATLICPANIPHQLINVGDEPTDHLLVLGVDSKIFDLTGSEMNLPWRK